MFLRTSLLQKIIKAVKNYKNKIEQLDLFSNFDKEDFEPKTNLELIEGKVISKDGKDYQYKRSNKDPNVNRLFRVDHSNATPDLFTDINDNNFHQKDSIQNPQSNPIRHKKETTLKITPNEMQENLFGEVISTKGRLVLISQGNKLKIIKRDAPEKPNEPVQSDNSFKLDKVYYNEKIPESKALNEKNEIERVDLFEPSESEKITPEEDLILKFGAEGLEGGEAKRRKQREETNKQVYTILEKPDNEITNEDKQVLAKYSGKGGTDELSLNEYYSTTGQAKFMWNMLRKFGFKGGKVLEPSCATGVFLHTAPDDVLMIGVELSDISSRIAMLLHGDKYEITNESFEEFYEKIGNEKFNAVIGNCPFGGRGLTIGSDIEMSHLKTCEQYFIERGIDCLESGGLIGMIVNTGIMSNSSYGQWRNNINKKAEFLGSIRMPIGAFSHAHANVTTDIVFFKKRPEEIINLFQNLKDSEEQNLYNLGMLNANFISGNYFDENPNNALGETVKGNYGRTAQKGKLDYNELNSVGDSINTEETDYSSLSLYRIDNTRIDKESPKLGDIIIQNGRRYKFNENHRWERVENDNDISGDHFSTEQKEVINRLGLTATAFYDLQYKMFYNGMNLNHDDRMIIGGDIAKVIDDELSYFNTVPEKLKEKLAAAIAIGMAIKDFKVINTNNGEISDYSEKIKLALINFIDKFGSPDDLKRYSGKGKHNALIHFIGSIDNDGKVSKEILNPFEFSPNESQLTKNYDTENINDIIEMIENEKIEDPTIKITLDKIINSYTGEETPDSIMKSIIDNENFVIDENGEFRSQNNVYGGEINSKLDSWESNIILIDTQLKNEDIPDIERELLTGIKDKLNRQIIEAKSRAGYKDIKDLPISMSDSKEGLFDITILNEYLSENLPQIPSLIEIDENGKYNFADPEYAYGYNLFCVKSKADGEINRQENEKEDKKTKKEETEKNKVIAQLRNELFPEIDNNEGSNNLSDSEYANQLKINASELNIFLRKYFKDPEDKSKILTNPMEFVLLNYLNDTKTKFSDKYSRDTEEKIQELEEGFIPFLENREENLEVATNYNRKYNNWMQKNYSDSIIEGIEKLGYDKELIDRNGKLIKVKDAIAPNQWESIRRMIDQGKGMLAHGVGVGKTFQAIAIVLMQKQSGRAKKPLIVTPKSILLNWVDEVNKWTNNGNPLIVGYKKNAQGEWIAENNSEKLAKLYEVINNGNKYDMILMSRDTFDSIRYTKKTKKYIIENLVNKFVNLSGLDTSGMSVKERKLLDKKINALQQQFMSAMIDNRDSFKGITFEDLGIDMIVRDEAHDTKSLLRPLTVGDVKGFSSGSMSSRAMNYYIATKLIRDGNDDQNIFSLTATPISNSPIEVFNMMLPFAENEMAKIGVKNMDDFIKKFAKMEELPTVDTDGRVLMMKKFAGWKSGDTLRKMFFKFVDYKTSKDIKGTTVKFPTENPNYVLSSLNEGQQILIDQCRNRLWACRVLSRSKMKEFLKAKDHLLLDNLSSINMENLYKKFDKDNLNPLEEAYEAGAVSDEEYTEIKTYFKSYFKKFLQLNSINNESLSTDGFFKIQTDMLKATGDLNWYKEKASDYGLPIDKEFLKKHEDNEKINLVTNSVLSAYNAGEKQLLFTVNTTLHQSMKNKLISMGIKPDEIVIVNGEVVSDSDDRLQISKDFNSGKYKIVIGNYATMGEGLNFNNGTAKIHHLQTTWNHLPVQQGNGRGIRQGNPKDVVDTYYYLAKGSVDSFMSQRVMDKKNMVDSFLRGESDVYDDDIYMDEDQMLIELARDPQQAAKLVELQKAKKNKATEKYSEEKQLKSLSKYIRNKQSLKLIGDTESTMYQNIIKENSQIEDYLTGVNSKYLQHLSETKPPYVDVKTGIIIPIHSIFKKGKNKNYQVYEITKTGFAKILEFDPEIRGYDSYNIPINQAIKNIDSGEWKQQKQSIKTIKNYVDTHIGDKATTELLDYLCIFSEKDLNEETKKYIYNKVEEMHSKLSYREQDYHNCIYKITNTKGGMEKYRRLSITQAKDLQKKGFAPEMVLPFDEGLRSYIGEMSLEDFKTSFGGVLKIGGKYKEYYKSIFMEKNNKQSKLNYQPNKTKKAISDLLNEVYSDWASGKFKKETIEKETIELQNDLKDGFFPEYAKVLFKVLSDQLGVTSSNHKYLNYRFIDENLINEDIIDKLEFIDYHLGTNHSKKVKIIGID